MAAVSVFWYVKTTIFSKLRRLLTKKEDWQLLQETDVLPLALPPEPGKVYSFALERFGILPGSVLLRFVKSGQEFHDDGGGRIFHDPLHVSINYTVGHIQIRVPTLRPWGKEVLVFYEHQHSADQCMERHYLA